MHKLTLTSLLLLLIAPSLYGKGTALTTPSIPWGASEEEYMDMNRFKASTSKGETKTYEAKELITITEVPFIQVMHFLNNKGLSQITYLSDLNNEPYQSKCLMVQSKINEIYGKRTNEVHVNDHDKNDYAEAIWTSKLDRIVRLFCYNNNNHNYVSVTIFPRWTVLDCSLHDADKVSEKKENNRAFFYFDKVNETIRFFNNNEVTPPFTSSYHYPRIEFSHNNPQDHTTIDLNTGVIMSKFSDNGKHSLMVGKCKIQP